MSAVSEALQDLKRAASDYVQAKMARAVGGAGVETQETLDKCVARLTNASLVHAAAVLREQAGALK